jgi:proteic killer suppression protein
LLFRCTSKQQLTQGVTQHKTIDSVAQQATLSYIIKSFKHKGLKKFFESGNTKGIQAAHSNKLRMQLAALDTATNIDDIDIPGYQLHKLQGNQKDRWSISVNGNWRVTFDFSESNVYIVNYKDYH